MLQLLRIGSGAVLAACLLLVIACAPQNARPKGPACPPHEQLRPLLNSERIKSCFGSYGVEVLSQEGRLRISSLYSLNGDERTTRTLAISEFAHDLPDSLNNAYQAIRAGSSMGATLESAGWRVDKRQRYLGELELAKASGCLSSPPERKSEQNLAVQVYDLYAIKGKEVVRFALLAELHDPRYLSLPDLQHIYAATDEQLQQPDSASEQLLQALAAVCVLLR